MLINKQCVYREIEIKTNIDLKNIESIWIELTNCNTYLCGFYRSHNYCNIDLFLDYMIECMKKLHGKKVIWIGDININQNDIKSLPYKKLDIVLKSLNMVQTIQGITRTAMHGKSITHTTHREGRVPLSNYILIYPIIF